MGIIDIQAAKRLITHLIENVSDQCAVEMGLNLVVRVPFGVIGKVPDTWEGYPIKVEEYNIAVDSPLELRAIAPDFSEPFLEIPTFLDSLYPVEDECEVEFAEASVYPEELVDESTDELGES
jgi:hypothetical protein